MDAEVFPSSWVTRIAVKVVTVGIINRLHGTKPKFVATLPSHPAGPVRRKRMCGTDLRDCLVSVAAVGHRIVRGIARRVARDLHGRDVPGQYPASQEDFDAASSSAGLCLSRTRDRSAGVAGTVADPGARPGLCGG